MCTVVCHVVFFIFSHGVLRLFSTLVCITLKYCSSLLYYNLFYNNFMRYLNKMSCFINNFKFQNLDIIATFMFLTTNLDWEFSLQEITYRWYNERLNFNPGMVDVTAGRAFLPEGITSPVFSAYMLTCIITDMIIIINWLYTKFEVSQQRIFYLRFRLLSCV